MYATGRLGVVVRPEIVIRSGPLPLLSVVVTLIITSCIPIVVGSRLWLFQEVQFPLFLLIESFLFVLNVSHRFLHEFHMSFDLFLVSEFGYSLFHCSFLLFRSTALVAV